jgi:hypothetical protein
MNIKRKIGQRATRWPESNPQKERQFFGAEIITDRVLRQPDGVLILEEDFGLACACALHNAGQPESLQRVLRSMPGYTEAMGWKENSEGVALVAMGNELPPFKPWLECVKILSDELLKRFAQWRDLSWEFCVFLRDQLLIGWYEEYNEGYFCFPIHGPGGAVIGEHVLTPASKRGKTFCTAGARGNMSPILLGALPHAGRIFIGESIPDIFALADRTDLWRDPKACFIATRGASNAKLITGSPWPRTDNGAAPPAVFLVAQNDTANENWIKGVTQIVPFPYHVWSPPKECKDFNDWTREGATRDILLQQITDFEEYAEPQSSASVNGASAEPKTPEELEEERIAALYAQYAILKPKPLAQASRTLPSELISGILYQGRRMLLTGGSKARKTWMMHQMAYCLANGLSLFDRFPTKPTRVFYVNFELMEAGSALRFDAISEALGAGSQNDITIISVSDYLDLVKSDFPEYLALLARDNRAGAAMIDPMWRLLGEREENSNTAIGQLLRPLVRFSREAHASMIGAHHHAKGHAGTKEAIDQASGAGAFIRDPSTIFVMLRLSAFRNR